MRRVIQLLYIGIIGVIFVGLVTGLFAYLLFTRSLPDYSQEFTSIEVSAPFEIVRDTHNIPHILAQTDRDAFFGLGYAHAQDRLWQMVVARRTVQGRMSETFGDGYLQQDRLYRQLQLFRNARFDVQGLDEQTRTLLEAYAAGVNHYIRDLAQNARGRGAPEFYFFTPEIAPWRPADTLALLRLQDWRDTNAHLDEIARAQIALSSSSQSAEDFLGENPNSSIVKPVAFAATGARTLTGETLFSAEIADALTAPSQTYLARMNLEAGPVIGITIPGIPLVFAGRNLQQAWAILPGRRDVADLAVIPPTLLEDVSERFELIQIVEQPTHSEPIMSLGDAVLIPHDFFSISEITPSQHRIALQWTGLEKDTVSVSALIELMQITDLNAAETRLKDLKMSRQIMIASRQSLTVLDAGSMPKRSAWQGSNNGFPYLADRPEALWLAQDPSIAIQIVQEDLVTPWHGLEVKTAKDRRLLRLLSLRDVHSARSFQDIQTDIISEEARSLLPIIARELWFSELPSSEDPVSVMRASALDLLADWNGEMSSHLPQPLIYSAWLWELQRQIVRDELGPASHHFTKIRDTFISDVFLDRNGLSVWCDITPSAAVETCDQIALRALNVALMRLADTYGSRVDSWLWEEAHQARHTHPTLGSSALIDWLTSIYQPASGGAATLNETAFNSIDGIRFDVTQAPIARMFVDFSGSEPSGFILSTGQSGHFMSPFYDNLATRWRQGEYLTMSFDLVLARAGAVGTTIIKPALR
ncbi:MAG: penicillin acylase family protein [Pseudomonadota bacterium]